MTDRTYSEAELARILQARLREQADSMALDGLKAELNRMTKSIVDANHIKREIGAQMTDLSTTVKAHIAQANQNWARFGVNDVSDEHAETFPEMLASFVVAREREASEADRRAGRKEWYEQTWTRIGIAAGAAYVLIQLGTLFFSAYNALHGVHNPLH